MATEVRHVRNEIDVSWEVFKQVLLDHQHEIEWILDELRHEGDYITFTPCNDLDDDLIPNADRRYENVIRIPADQEYKVRAWLFPAFAYNQAV